MKLTSVTQAMLERALREESLLRGGEFWPPARAVANIAKSMFEHSCADLGVDEQEVWDSLPTEARRMELKNATWLIGRLSQEGYLIVKR